MGLATLRPLAPRRGLKALHAPDCPLLRPRRSIGISLIMVWRYSFRAVASAWDGQISIVAPQSKPRSVTESNGEAGSRCGSIARSAPAVERMGHLQEQKNEALRMKLRNEVDSKTFRGVTAEIDAAHDQLAREHKRLASEAAMPGATRPLARVGDGHGTAPEPWRARSPRTRVRRSQFSERLSGGHACPGVKSKPGRYQARWLHQVRSP